MSRKPPSTKFPFGLAKFDTAGMLAVSAILVMGSIGIGLHSYHVRIVHLSLSSLFFARKADSILFPSPTSSSFCAHARSFHLQLLSVLPLPDSNILSHLPHLPTFLPSHAGHSHSEAVVDAAGILDPNAAWTALLSVVVKEWLYRVTKKVGDEEGSSVLVANVSRSPYSSPPYLSLYLPLFFPSIITSSLILLSLPRSDSLSSPLPFFHNLCSQRPSTTAPTHSPPSSPSSPS